MTDYKYGDSERSDRLMEEHTLQGYRPAKVAKMAREIELAAKKVDEAIAASKALKEKVKPLCTHAIEDLVYSTFTLFDTRGCSYGSRDYLTCKLCNKELWSRYGRDT